MTGTNVRRRVRYVLLLAMLAWFYGLAPVPVFAIEDCGERCTLTGSCDWVCWSGPNLITCGEYNYTCETCGNYYCNENRNEDAGNCAVDCEIIDTTPDCGNAECEVGESPASCEDDCTDDYDTCGDNVCGVGENTGNCLDDCVYTDLCFNTFECLLWRDNNYVCSASIGGRCIYAPNAHSCDATLQALDCPDPDMKCQNGICVEMF